MDSGTRIYGDETRTFLSQYIVRAPLSLIMIEWDQEQDTVTWKAPRNGYFKGKERHFSCLDFIAQLTLHIPPRGKHLLRRYGLVRYKRGKPPRFMMCRPLKAARLGHGYWPGSTTSTCSAVPSE